MTTEVTIRKMDHTGRETWRYTGRLLEQGHTWVKIEAFFNRDDRDDGYVVWRRGDRFIEWFYSDRWYNVFEVHDVTDDRLKGFYCNITRPALIEGDLIGYPDLALDLWIDPTGSVLVLDEHEFAVLPVDDVTRAAAWNAIEDLRSRVDDRDPPFDVIG